MAISNINDKPIVEKIIAPNFVLHIFFHKGINSKNDNTIKQIIKQTNCVFSVINILFS